MARSVAFDIIANDRASATFDKVAASASGLSDKLSAAGAKMASAGKKMTEAITLPVVGAGVAAGKLATDFQASMEQISSQAGVPQSAIKGLSKGVLDLAGTVGTAPGNLADALYHIESSFASTGITGKQAMNLLKIAAEGAKVGQADLVDVTNALDAAVVSNIKGVQNQSQAMGVLNAVVGSGDMKMQDLADALGTGILASAKTFGLSITDVGAALATFGDNNIRGTDAATKLRQALSLMAAPSGPAAAALASIGIGATELADDMQKPNGLLVALQDLKKHLDASGLSASQQAQILSQAFGGGRTSSAIMILLSQLDRLQSKYGDITKGANQFGSDWAKTTDTAKFKFDQAIASLEAAGIKLGNKILPFVSSVADAISGLIDDFSNLPDSVQTAALIGGGFAAAVGPIVYVTGKVTTLIGNLKDAWNWLGKLLGGSSAAGGAAGGAISTTPLDANTAALNRLTAAIEGTGLGGAAGGEAGAAGAGAAGAGAAGAEGGAAAAGGIAGVVSKIGGVAPVAAAAGFVVQQALGGGFDLASKDATNLKNNLDLATKTINSMSTSTKPGLTAAISATQSELQTAEAELKRYRDSGQGTTEQQVTLMHTIDQLKGHLSDLEGQANNSSATFHKLSDSSMNAGQQAQASVPIWDKVWQGIQAGAGAVVGFFEGLPGEIVVGLSSLGGMIAGVFSGAWNAVYATTSGWAGAVVGFVSGIPGQIFGALSGLAGLIAGEVSGAWNAVYATTSGWVGGIVNFVAGIPGAIYGALASLGALIASEVSGAWNAVYATTSGWVGGIVNFVAGIPGWIYGALSSLASGLYSIGSSAFSALANAIVATATTVYNAAASIVGTVFNAFVGAGTWLYNTGGDIIGGLLNGIWSAMKGIGDWVKTNIIDPVVNAVKHFFGISSPSTVFHEIGSNMIQGLINGILSKDAGGLILKVFGSWPSALAQLVKGGLADVAKLPSEALNAIGSALASLFGTGGGATGGIVALMEAMNAARGWAGFWSALYQLEMREAGFNMTARNPSSGAYGLAQFIQGPSGYAAYGGNANTPQGQITAMLNYIAQRYGNPGAAWAHEIAAGWYDAGGWLPTGVSMAVNRTGRPEPVGFDYDEMAAAIKRGGGTGGPAVGTMNNYIQQPVDWDAALNNLEFRTKAGRL